MSKFRCLAFAVALLIALGAVGILAAQEKSNPNPAAQQESTVQADQGVQPEIFHPRGTIIVPESSIVRPEDAGVRAHTNVLIFQPEGMPISSPEPNNTFGETPQSLACVYQNGVSYSGCTPSGGSGLYPHGGWGAIVLVDAYDNPHAASDLAAFSSHYGLPAATFRKVYANTSFGVLNGLTASCSGTPPGDTGWGLEEDLDIEAAHAMSTHPVIVLVEACSNSYNDLLFAEEVAGIKAYVYGGGDVSNSWGSNEFSGEAGNDVHFYDYWQHVVYFASAGDSGWGAAYPSSSPWIVSAGGTTINRDSGGNYQNQSCWAGSGGGESTQEIWSNLTSLVNFQYEFMGTGARATPDIAADADPASGLVMYDTYGYSGFVQVGGTSLASPLLAGIVNISNNRLGQGPVGTPYYSNEEDDLIYSQQYGHATSVQNFTDVTSGCNGSGHCAAAGYDECTGIGIPRGHGAK